MFIKTTPVTVALLVITVIPQLMHSEVNLKPVSAIFIKFLFFHQMIAL